MDQNSNNNLFNFGDQQPEQPEQPQQPPQPPQQPVQPYNTNDQPTVLSSGPAQVYNTPPSYQPVEPPPPPVYTPPPASFGAQPPKKSNRTIWIVAIVVVLLLCCCCLIGAGVWLYNNGDQFINDYSFILPTVQSFLA